MIFGKKLLSPEQEQRLVEAIAKAERETSGEIRVHIEKNSRENPVTACVAMFRKLNMHHTKDRNGILLYLAYRSKSFAVWGDEGIHEVVGDHFWKNISDQTIPFFSKGDYITGLEKAVAMCGEQLKQHFPRRHNDQDELPNQISY